MASITSKTRTKTGGSNDKAVIFPYNKRSRGYRELTKALDLKYPSIAYMEQAVISNEAVKFGTLINWGSGNLPGWATAHAARILNPVSAVNICRNKVKFFNAIKDVARVPEYTEDFEEALRWVQEGRSVMGRKINGSCGEDITFYEDNPGQFQSSEFWVQYKKKKHEFRVHVFNGDIISLQQKAIRTSDEQGQSIPAGTIDFRIRNHRNGFIFKRNEISVPNDVRAQALAAAKAIEKLTFGAVDVIYNQYEDKAYVLEINTAPGLEGTTVEHYVEAFRKAL